MPRSAQFARARLLLAPLAVLGLLIAALTVAPASRATEAAAARPQSPLVMVFQKQKDPTDIKARADEVAAILSRELGRPVKAFVPTDYAATVQALVSKRADFAYVSAIPFLLARRDGGATLLLAEVREDAQGVSRTTYDSVFVVPHNSPLQTLDDLTRESKNLRIAFTSTTSTSGYVMAYRRLVTEELLKPKQDPKEVFRSVSFGGSYTQALQQVLTGRADVCAVSFYTVEGSTADTYTTPDERKKLRILARTPDVPTHLVCARGGLDDETRSAMRAAILKLARERPDLLASVYGARVLAEVDENEHVRPAVEALDYLGVPLESLAR
jgi:phosphonate transport system substrate-binding protein